MMLSENKIVTTAQKNLLIFDLDGVITSEEAYWDCAGLTLHELLYSPRYWNLAADNQDHPAHVASVNNAQLENGALEQTPTPTQLSTRIYQPATHARESREVSRAILPEWLILSFKARALNSNWDTCYAAVCLHLVALLNSLSDHGASLLPFQPWDATWLASLRTHVATGQVVQIWDTTHLQEEWHTRHPFDSPVFHGATGLDLFERMDIYARQMLGYPVEGVFSRHGPFWRFCVTIFQEWLLGDALYTRTQGHAPEQTGKPGCIFFEEPLLPMEQLHTTLTTLRERGYTLGIASGRVRQEAAKPLEKYDLLRYFDEEHLGTYDVVLWGEAELRKAGHQATLGKPHPFQFQAAVDRAKALALTKGEATETPDLPFVAVGDSTSDILAGRAAGALTVAVLTGARSPEAHELLLRSQPDFVIEDITRLPALLDDIDTLATIQKLQFERREVAEKLLHLWFTRHMGLAVASVRLTPKAVSLNSFNGFFTHGREEYFFKTHVEEHGVLDEYYHARLLDEAGYNVVRPLRLLREKNRQMVIYPVVAWPVMFELMRAIETGQKLPAGITSETVLAAEKRECGRLLEIYQATLRKVQTPSQQFPPIHQLFWHRLSGERFQRFYESRMLPLPVSGTPRALPFASLQGCRWIINGVEQAQTLGELVRQARESLHPARVTATVVGHGDAHFGNVFLAPLPQAQGDLGYLYFDPAFAGHHAPLLDIIKPLYHNVFATWMYFPEEVAHDLQLTVKHEGECIIVEHNYRLAPIRHELLRVKKQYLLQPLLAWLEKREELPEDWRAVLNLALMCCPLLTVDLFDEQKRPAQIGWLGLAQAVQLGNSGIEGWEDTL